MNPKIKKIAFIAGVVLVLAASVPLFKFLIEKVRAFPNTTLSFSPAARIVGPNQDFTLDAMIDPKTNQVTVVSLRVTFDPTKLRLDGINTSGSPFTVTLLPAAIDNVAGTAAIDIGIYPGDPPVTSIARMAVFSFHSLAAATNSPIVFTAASLAAALGEGSTNVITDLFPAQVTVDTAAPAGGSINYTNGYFTAASIALTANDGTDAVSGINTSSRIVQRRSSTLTGTTCGAYGAWGTITPSGTYPNFTDSTVANGNCYQYQYLVSDNVGNQATYISTNVAKVDTTAPTLAQVMAVPSPTNDNTPDYTFSSTEAGTIAYGGDCGSSTTTAVSGNNTVTFNSLSNGAHSNCTIRVTDAAGNQSGLLNVNSFTVDAAVPTIVSVTSTKADGTYSAGAVIDIVVNFSEAVTSAGNATVTLDTGKSCAFTVNNSITGSCDYTVQANDNSSDLTTTSISGMITDQAGNAMTNFTPVANLGANKNLVISAILPVLTQVTAVPSIDSNTTPDYIFSSSAAGTITYSGNCASAITAAVAGNNTITFSALSVGDYNNCAIIITDLLGNASLPLNVGSFAITYRGDLNTDRVVNLFDYNILSTNYGNTTCGNQADADKNCAVNLFDYNVLIEDYGKSF